MRIEYNSIGFIEWEYRDHKTVEITNLVVNPNLRRHGIGKQLMEEALLKFETDEIHYVYVFSEADNDGAHQFYLAQNFKLCGELTGFYKFDDAVIFGRLVRAPA